VGWRQRQHRAAGKKRENAMMARDDDSIQMRVREMPRRETVLKLGALGLAAIGALGGDRVEASRCHRKKRKCKARCERKHPAESLGLAGCRSGCGLRCGF
jgi:hypothetical protein